MPEAINGARYACQKCMNGHRTKTCQHWKNENAKFAESVNLEEVAPGESPENIAVFAKTRSAGRPKAADLEKDKTGTTLYILLKTTVDGKQSCKAIGEIDLDADGNKKETRKMSCCQSEETSSASPEGHSRAKSSTDAKTPSRDNAKIEEISYETTKKDSDHKCQCGSICTCSFCPQHPNTKATQDIMRRVADQVQQRYRLKPKGEVEFREPFQEIIPCGGGQISGENSQIYATDDESQLEAWRQQQDGTGNYITSIPMQFAFDYGIGSPTQIRSPRDGSISLDEGVGSTQSQHSHSQSLSGYPDSEPQGFALHSPHGSRSEMEFFLSQHQWDPRDVGINHQGVPQQTFPIHNNGQPHLQAASGQPSFLPYRNGLFLPENAPLIHSNSVDPSMLKSAPQGPFSIHPSQVFRPSSHFNVPVQNTVPFGPTANMYPHQVPQRSGSSHGYPGQNPVDFGPDNFVTNIPPTHLETSMSMDIDPDFSSTSLPTWHSVEQDAQFWQQPIPPRDASSMPFPV